ncbi:MAG: proton-conducting transporter membrane subunit [Candidatus Bipolaricaulota bacterium]
MIFAAGGVLAYFFLGVVGIVAGRGRLGGALAILAGLVSLGLWAPGFPEGLLGDPPWGIPLVGDRLALAFWCLIPLVHAAVWWHERRRPSAFHGLVTLLVGTCLATVLSRDLFNLYVVLELGSLLSFLLIGYDARSRAVWASLQYLILATVGMVLYLFGVGLVYGTLGTLSLSRIAEISPDFSQPSLAVGVGLLVTGAAVKAGVFPLGLWLPTAHGQAPTGVSTLLSGLIVKMSILALARLAQDLPVGPIVVALGVLTGFGGLLYALWETDIKAFLAYHTMSQMGYSLIGIGLGGPALFAGILFAVAHCLFKGLLFQAAGEGVEAVGERDVPALAGRLPRPAAWGLALGTWTIVGLPPLASFVAKEYLGQGIPPAHSWVLVLFAVGTAASFSKLIPLFRAGSKGDGWGGVGLLAAGLIGFSVWGLMELPALWAADVWAKAVGAVVLGYGMYLLLRRVRPRLPAVTMDRVSVAILIGAVVIPLAMLLRP